MFTSLKRVINAGWISFRRQAGLSLANVFIMTLVISAVTALFLFHQVSQFLIKALEEKVDISVYFREITPESEILRIKDEIAKIPEVRQVEYVSQEAAAERLLARRPELIDSVGETEGFLNIASLNIKVYTADQYAAVASFLENSPFAQQIDIDYYERKPVIERIFSINSAINRAGIALSAILGVIAFLMAFNQVKLAIFNAREEIGIQRLVGASNWFIRGPFLAQGVFAGVAATLVSFLIFLTTLAFLGPKMEILFPGLNLFSYFIANFFLILSLQLLTGIGLGIISSLIAMRKYLEV
jgi:cell division transport system permease protein